MIKSLKKIQLWSAKQQLKGVRADFYFDISVTLEDRVSLFSTLQKYEARARRRDPGMAPLYLHMTKAVQHGSLATAMRGVATPMEMIIIDASQAGGDESMSKSLSYLSELVEQTDGMVSKVRSAVTYPLLLLGVFILMLTGFSFFAVPVLTQMLSPDKWPPLGQALYWVAGMVREWGWLMLCCLLSVLMTFFWSLENWVGSMRRRFDRHLPYSIYRDYQGALLLVALASLMRSGVSLQASLERGVSYSSPWVRWHLREIMRRLAGADARNFGNAFQTGILPPVLEERVQDASERRNPIESFVRIGVGSLRRMERVVARSANTLNGLMLLMCGLCLIFMIGGFLSTSFELQQGMRTR